MMPFDAGNAKAKDIAVSVKEAVEEVMVLLQLGIAPLIVQDRQERLGRNFGKGPRSFVGDRWLGRPVKHIITKCDQSYSIFMQCLSFMFKTRNIQRWELPKEFRYSDRYWVKK
jgi:hypothetical protein